MDQMHGHTDPGTLLDRYRTSLGAEERRELSGAPGSPFLSEGAQAGDWTVLGFLARGGSSDVHCARHRTLGTPAVLKVLWRTEPRQLERFRREVRFLMENPGPSFPAFYGSGETDGRPWMAIEPLDEFPLPSTDAAVARYLLDVAAGVSALHAKGWLHRDIKPANILRRADGHAVLADFGLLKKIGSAGGGDAPSADSSALSVVDGRAVGVGTPGYAAPEQFGGGPATPALDVYALGVLANRCFGGPPPRPWRRIVLRATAPLGLRCKDVPSLMRAIRHRHLPRRLVLAAALALSALLFTLLATRHPTVPEEASIPEDAPATAEPYHPLPRPVVQPSTPPPDVPGLSEISDWFAARDEVADEIVDVLTAERLLQRTRAQLGNENWSGATATADRGLEVLGEPTP